MALLDLLMHETNKARHNHAVEHATLQILGSHKPRISAGGYSDPQGFWIIGDFSAEEILKAASEAIIRLRAGETGLAIHPNCGTNFVATGMLAGSAAWLAMLPPAKSMRSRLDRWPFVVIFVTLALMLSQPVGPWLQLKFTTDARIGALKILHITRYPRKGIVVHRIRTE